MLEAPEHIISSIDRTFGLASRTGLTANSLEKLFRSGEFAVFGEISIQYEGYSASDSAFEPYMLTGLNHNCSHLNHNTNT